ncbi:MAG: DUF697 domain-containing protein [Cyanobacteria bacterium P01_F01_bin.153]
MLQRSVQWFREKPVWVIGAGMAASWAVLDMVHGMLSGADNWLTVGLVAAGAGLWISKKKGSRSHKGVVPSSVEQLGRSQVEKLLKITEERLASLEQEGDTSQNFEPWRSQLARLEADLDWREMTEERSLLVVGGRHTGKSTLRAVLPHTYGEVEFKWTERTAFFADETTCADDSFAGGDLTDSGADDEKILTAALAADGVILLLAGDLTATELVFLQRLCADATDLGKAPRPQPLVVINKRDQWLPEEEQGVLARVQQRLTGIIPPERIVSAAAAPREIKVRRYQDDGSKVELMEQPAPAITEISTALETWAQQSADHLRWGAPMRLLHTTFQDIQGALNQTRRTRSLAAIDQSQWIAAAAAFANPLPGLDLVATAAVNGQLVMDLGAVYQLSFDLERATAIAKTFGELMIKQGLVELSSQAIAGALKTNAMTYVAGGAIQGMSAAYLTRVAGLALVEIFEAHSAKVAITDDETWLSPERIGAALQTTFNRVRDGFGWQDFFNQATQRLSLSATV